MLRIARYALPFLLVLVALYFATSTLLQRESRRWSEQDLALRAELAVNAARESLAQPLQSGDEGALRRALAGVRGAGVLSASACSSSRKISVATDGFPLEVDCRSVLSRLQTRSDPDAWRSAREILDGRPERLLLAAVPIRAAEGHVVGAAVVVQDLGFADRRAVLAQKTLLAVLAFIGGMGVLVLLAASRLSFRHWTAEVCRMLRGGDPRPAFQPVLRLAHELASRLAATELRLGSGAAGWSPQRLKRVLAAHFPHERLIVLANREPYVHDRAQDGSIHVSHPAGGLVTALEPVMRACSGVWVAHGSGSADHDTVDRHDRVLMPPGERSFAIRRVWLSKAEVDGYYHGFANEGLWPLCHIAHAQPVFRTEDWQHYKAVNSKFAEAVCREAASEDPVVLVQDYHFALAPRMIRERLPKATILTYWHIPWPNAERFGICPWHQEILRGLAGSSIVGFHTQLHCNNFLDAFDRFMEARIDREQQAVVQSGHPTLVRAYPISIEWPSREAASAPPVAECRASVFAKLGLRPDALLGIGIDRIDYTKGIEERLLAVERLLERSPQLQGRFTFAQLGAPSRTGIARYGELTQRLEALVERINARFGSGDYRPIVWMRANHEPATVFQFYRAADVCYVSSLHDGMNLVAKEFVAARDDERGVLVLSHFTGAARELTESLVVNPYDLDEASAAMEAALVMTPGEQADRMRAMREVIAENNVYRWAGRMLADAGRRRSKDRLFGRLTHLPKPAQETCP